MKGTKTTDSLKKNLAKDIEYLRAHIETSRQELSEMVFYNMQDATRRRNKIAFSLRSAQQRLRDMQNGYVSGLLEGE